MADDTRALLDEALSVINAALAKHGSSTPYEQLIALSERTLGERNLGVEIYRGDAPTPSDLHTLRFQDGRFERIAGADAEPDVVWKVSQDYLREVANDPQTYIDHPIKLDWEWLKSRLGMD